MTVLTYLDVATNQTYDSDAWDYVTGTEVLKGITRSSEKLGISAGAIAGAMAEEQISYDFLQKLVDDYARYGALTEEDINELENNPPENFFTQAWFAGLNIATSPEDERSQAEWVAEWETISDGLETNYKKIQERLDGWKITRVEKLRHPSLIDAGLSNMRIAVAMRLVNQYSADYEAYDLSVYLNPEDGYVRLVDNLMDEEHPLAAHLYGLYLKEAEMWFKDNGAYDGQWDNLPQPFRDALLITFVNIGEPAMKRARQELYIGRALPYEPLPGMTAAAGMNHLYNAEKFVENIPGLEGYDNVESVDSFEDKALVAGESGLAYRYALYRLRYVAVTGLDYSDYNQNGEIDLYDENIGKGSMSESYIHDRCLMVKRLTYLRMQRGFSMSQLEYEDLMGMYSFYDAAQKINIIASEFESIIQFGDNEINTLSGGNQADHLYGMGGNDTLDGGSGANYLEGGADHDTYILQMDGKADTLVDVDGDGEIRVDSELVSGTFTRSFDGGVYLSGDSKWGLRERGDGDWDLLGRNSDNEYEDIAVLKDWEDGALGLSLSQSDPDYIVVDKSTMSSYFFVFSMNNAPRTHLVGARQTISARLASFF